MNDTNGKAERGTSGCGAETVDGIPRQADRSATLERLRTAVRQLEAGSGSKGRCGHEGRRRRAAERATAFAACRGGRVSSAGSAAGPRPLGVAEADRILGGGFPAEGLTEIRADAVRDAGAALGFALALAVLFKASPRRPVLWIAPAETLDEAGSPYGPGLAAFGLDPQALVVVRTRRLSDAAWAGEEAARSGALALTILELRGNPGRLSLEGTRRLHVRAQGSGCPVLLLRQGAAPETTAAPLRLHLSPGPAAPVAGLGDLRLIGRPAFRLAVEKARDGSLDRMLLEWDPHGRRFLAAALPGALPDAAVDGPDPAREARPVLAFPRPSLASEALEDGRRGLRRAG